MQPEAKIGEWVQRGDGRLPPMGAHCWIRMDENSKVEVATVSWPPAFGTWDWCIFALTTPSVPAFKPLTWVPMTDGWNVSEYTSRCQLWYRQPGSSTQWRGFGNATCNPEGETVQTAPSPSHIPFKFNGVWGWEVGPDIKANGGS